MIVPHMYYKGKQQRFIAKVKYLEATFTKFSKCSSGADTLA